jgi:hypothetical protein
LPQQDMVVHQDTANFLIAERSFSLYRCERVHSFLLGGKQTDLRQTTRAKAKVTTLRRWAIVTLVAARLANALSGKRT